MQNIQNKKFNLTKQNTQNQLRSVNIHLKHANRVNETLTA